jgi:hypothetical protein
MHFARNEREDGPTLLVGPKRFRYNAEADSIKVRQERVQLLASTSPHGGERCPRSSRSG